MVHVVFAVFVLLCLSAGVFLVYRWAVCRYEQKVIAEFQEAQKETRKKERVQDLESECLEALRLLEERQRSVSHA